MLLLVAMSLATAAFAAPYKTVTYAATNVGAYYAELKGGWYGVASQEGFYQFLYGETTNYGSESAIGKIYPSMEGWEQRSMFIHGLKPETTYHFNFGTANMAGEEALGGDMTFTTKSIPRFEAGQYAATVDATQVEDGPMTFGLANYTLACQGVGASGVMQAATSSLKLNPTFSGCKFAGLNSTVTPNGCQFVYHPGDLSLFTTTMDVTCPEGEAIKVTTATCTVMVSPEAGLSKARVYKSQATPAGLVLEHSITGVDYNTTRDGIGCPLNGTGAGTNGTISGSQTLSAKNQYGVAVDLKIGY